MEVRAGACEDTADGQDPVADAAEAAMPWPKDECIGGGRLYCDGRPDMVACTGMDVWER